MKKLIKIQKSGQALVEYSMILAFMAILAIVVVKTVGKKTVNTYDNIQNTMSAQGIIYAVPATPTSGS